MNTGSINKTVLSLAAVLGASMPVASYAIENPALDRCVQTFVQEVVPANRSADIRGNDIVAAIRSAGPRRTKVDLIARDEKDAKVIGRAACLMNQDGVLIAMYLYSSKPGALGATRPRVLARNVDTTQAPRTAFADDTKPF